MLGIVCAFNVQCALHSQLCCDRENALFPINFQSIFVYLNVSNAHRNCIFHICCLLWGTNKRFFGKFYQTIQNIECIVNVMRRLWMLSFWKIVYITSMMMARSKPTKCIKCNDLNSNSYNYAKCLIHVRLSMVSLNLMKFAKYSSTKRRLKDDRLMASFLNFNHETIS